jgi:ABC-type antimicrobial peptide transport system permease subunit
MTLHVRAEMPIGALVQSLRAAVAALDRNLPIVDVKTMERQLRETVSSQRLMAHFSVTFAGLALLLAAVGLYGVVACGVAQRTREIGIRVALGAQRRHVVWLALGETAGLFVAGVAAGIPAAFGASKIASSMLFGMRPDHPAVYGGVILLLAGTALAAALLPVRRALRVEPSIALRHE